MYRAPWSISPQDTPFWEDMLLKNHLPYHLGAGGIPLVFPPPLPIKAVEDNKLGGVKAGELLSGSLGFYAVNNHDMQKVHLRMKIRNSFLTENPNHVQGIHYESVELASSCCN